MKKIICLVFVMLLACFWTMPRGETAMWKFVVMADNQDSVIPNSQTGVDAQVPILAQYIAKEQPDLVVCVGDMISGWQVKGTAIAGNYGAMYQDWLQYMSPISSQGIPICVVRGNHDFGEAFSEFPEGLLQAYEKNMLPLIPATARKDETGLSYSYIPSGRKAKFIMLDNFYDGDGSLFLPDLRHPGQKLTTGKMGVNINWLQSELTKDGVNSGNYVFVFLHSPAYKPSNDRMDYCLFNQQPLRNKFWNTLQQNHATAYFCGHYHLYCRGEVDGIPQFVEGTGGGVFTSYVQANVDPALKNAVLFPTVSVPANGALHGYLVVIVDEGKGIISYQQRLLNANGTMYSSGGSCPLDTTGPSFPRIGGM